MTFKRKIIPALLIGGSLFASAGIAQANDSEELEKLRALVQELDQKIRVLDRKNELAEEAAAAKKKETPIVRASEDGFGFKSADGKNEIKFKALAQLDYRNYNAGTSTVDGFDFRRIRPSIEGTLFGKYDFRFVPEFGEAKTANATSTSGIVDAYIDARFTPWFQVRAGKFKPYVGLERLQSGADIKFIERSFVSNNILPNRDLGVSLHGDVLDGKLSYAAGIFNGVVDGGDNSTAQDTNGDKEYAVRLFTTPFKDSDSVLSGLGFGLAATHGNFNGTTAATGLPSYKTPGQQLNFFTYSATTFGFGDRTRWAPQAYYYYGPFGVIAEYARVSQDLKSGTLVDTVDNDAWQIAASWLITGEDASFKGVKPKQVFDTDGGGWGAWELVARYQENNIDDAAFNTNVANNNRFASPTASAKSAQAWAAGVNWYLNQNVKVALDYEKTSYEGGGGGTVAAPLDRPDEKTLFTRLQISY